MLEEVTTKVDNIVDEKSIDIDNFPNANDMKAISKLKYLELYKKESARLITLASESIFNSAKNGKLSYMCQTIIMQQMRLLKKLLTFLRKNIIM